MTFYNKWAKKYQFPPGDTDPLKAPLKFQKRSAPRKYTTSKFSSPTNFEGGGDFHTLNTTNDRLSPLGAFHTLITPVWLLKIQKNPSKCEANQFFTEPHTIFLAKLLEKLITKIFLFLLFKWAPSFNWVIFRLWALLSLRLGAYLDGSLIEPLGFGCLIGHLR